MATISRLNYDAVLTNRDSRTRNKEPIVPVTRLFQLLGIEDIDFDSATLSVSTAGLKRILEEFARNQPFDPEFYAESYPDIEAARLAGQVTNLHDHFVKTGFFEGRLPCEPPFDPVWYATYYPDLAAAIPTHDVAALRNHFLSAGLKEGRAGTEAGLAAGRAMRLEET